MFQQASKSLNWANAAGSNGNQRSAEPVTKSLAEIQAEEERQERERLERERKERKARQKEMGLAQACVWGSATTNLSWASRTATAAAAQQLQQQPGNNQKVPKQQPQQAGNAWSQQQQQPQQPQGFWDEPTPQQQQNLLQQNKNAQKQPQQQPKSANRNKKQAKEETKVAAIFRDKPKPQNEFEAWVNDALEKFQSEKLNADFDIPTFMGFLGEIESPYEVSWKRNLSFCLPTT